MVHQGDHSFGNLEKSGNFKVVTENREKSRESIISFCRPMRAKANTLNNYHRLLRQRQHINTKQNALIQ